MPPETTPTDRDAWLKEGFRLQSLSRWQEALACFQGAVRIAPHDLETLVQLGFAQIQLKAWKSAAETYERIVTLLPKDHRIWCNLSYLYEHAGELATAEDRARKAIRLDSNSGEAWNNLGMALRGQHRLMEAAQAFQQAVARQPSLSLAEFNLATTYLHLGNGRLGWPLYESRRKLPDARLRTSIAPTWDGSSLSGKKLLVYADQGAGDTLQFSRLLPELQRRSQATVVLSCPPELRDLISHVRGADQVVALESDAADAAAEIAVSSLPGALQLDLRHVPGTVPYIDGSQAELTAPLTEILRDISPGRFRVGLVWQGNPTQGHDYIRSMPLRTLLPLSEIPGVEWLSLQVNEEGRSQLGDVHTSWNLRDLGGRLGNFLETAAVMKHLELVLTVDTSVAHLAGALGRPVWTMLGHTPDWRWGVHGETCPWYPSMRLFRQPRWGDWDSVVRQVRHALRDQLLLDPR